MSDLGNGVYYSESDYAGLGRRLLILIIDGCVLGAICFALVVGFLYVDYAYFADGRFFTFEWYFGICLGINFVYLVILKPSRFRTLGYILTGVRIVTLQGTRPTFWQMTWRFLLWVFGPFNILVDVFWIGGDDHKQSIRDKFAYTYVIRKAATPVGGGVIKIVSVDFMLLRLLFREVQKG